MLKEKNEVFRNSGEFDNFEKSRVFRNTEICQKILDWTLS